MGWLKGNRRLQVGLVLLVPFLVLALLPGLFAPYGPNDLIATPFAKPSTTYLLGTDDLGRDILSRLIYAAREDLKISLSSTAISAVIGVLIGLLAGYRGGFIDVLVLRLTDVMLAFPSILLALFLIAIVGQSDNVVIFSLSLLFLPGFVRLARGLALSIRQRGFVEASALSGGGPLHIVRRHLLPNALGPILVGFALTASYALLAAATLSYLGLGTKLPNPSWGNMLQEAFGWLFLDWWAGIFPGACIVLVSLGYMLVAGGIEDALGRKVGFKPLGGGSAVAAPGAFGESLQPLAEDV
jgi:peptide/nickel transport system permease protein